MKTNLHDLEELLDHAADRLGDEAMLRLIAEECCELGQAVLKLIRSRNGETPMLEEDAMEHVIEEMADVSLVTGWAYRHLMNENGRISYLRNLAYKAERMYRRIVKRENI